MQSAAMSGGSRMFRGVGKGGKVGMFLVRFTADVTLTFFHAWLKTFPTFPSYPNSVSTRMPMLPWPTAIRLAPRSPSDFITDRTERVR